MEQILINARQLSAGEVTYNNTATGLTGAGGINVSSKMKSGLYPTTATISFGDVTGATGTTPVMTVGFLTNTSSFGSTGTVVPFKDMTTGLTTSGATGMVITAAEVLAGQSKTVVLDRSVFQNKLYATAKGVTGAPCICVKIEAP